MLPVTRSPSLDLGELTAVPIRTYQEHGAPEGTYLMRVPAGASGPVEAHKFAEHIHALEPVSVIVSPDGSEPSCIALDAGASVTIPPGLRHQVLAPSRRYPTAYLAILTPDHDDPSLAQPGGAS